MDITHTHTRTKDEENVTNGGEIDVSLQSLAAGVDGRAGVLAAVRLLEPLDEEDPAHVTPKILG